MMSYYAEYSTFFLNLLSAGLCTVLFLFALTVVFVARWRVFEKAGYPGWAGLVPFYRDYVMFSLLYGNGFRALLLLIPGYNLYLMLRSRFDLAAAFGQSRAFGYGLLFLPSVFTILLGFHPGITYDPVYDPYEEAYLYAA